MIRVLAGEQTWPLTKLRPHPENSVIFGASDEDEDFASFVAAIKANGLWEPIVIKADGTILSGHRRFDAVTRLGWKEVRVRVAEADEYRDEVLLLVRSNTDRRQLTPREIGLAFKRLKDLPREQGGAKGKKGGDTRSKEAKALRDQSAASGTLKARDEAADILKVGRHEASALETIFATPGVPEELKHAVDKKLIAPTPAAKIVAAEVKRQGGEITEPAPLKSWTAEKTTPQKPAPAHEHERRVEEAAERMQRAQAALLELYRSLDRVLGALPLKSVTGPTEHHEYAGLIRDVALRAWREIESVQGPTNGGRQMALSVVNGGKT